MQLILIRKEKLDMQLRIATRIHINTYIYIAIIEIINISITNTSLVSYRFSTNLTILAAYNIINIFALAVFGIELVFEIRQIGQISNSYKNFNNIVIISTFQFIFLDQLFKYTNKNQILFIIGNSRNLHIARYNPLRNFLAL